MKKSFLAFIVLSFATMMYGGDIVRVSATYEYTSNNPNETPEQAERTAIQKAREKALEEKFGLDVSSVSSTYVHSRTDGEETSSVADVFALGGTAVRGEWIETIEEKVLEESYVKGFWVIKVYVSGKARNNTKEKTEIKYALINNAHDKYGRDQYHDGDDIFLRFSSPVNGSLCVYLIDESQNAYCLLPYQTTTTGCQEIQANKEYLLFHAGEDRDADEYTVNCERSMERNAIYIIFTPNKLTKANDSKSGNNWRNEPMPRQLTYKAFLAWLSKNQQKDEDLVVKTEVITIRK